MIQEYFHCDNYNAITVLLPCSTYTWHLSPGWHMIGSVIDTVDFTNPQDTPDGSILTPVYSYDTQNGNYVATDTLAPGKGYWIAVLQECDLIVGKSSYSNMKPVSGKQTQTFYEQYGSTPPHPPSIDWHNRQTTDTPDHFEIFQNYPNPFNQTTTISYQLAKPVFVELSIYNVLGRKILTLINEKQPVGFHKIWWDGTETSGQAVTSGLYFIRIDAGEFVQTKKVLLIR